MDKIIYKKMRFVITNKRKINNNNNFLFKIHNNKVYLLIKVVPKYGTKIFNKILILRVRPLIYKINNNKKKVSKIRRIAFNRIKECISKHKITAEMWILQNKAIKFILKIMFKMTFLKFLKIQTLLLQECLLKICNKKIHSSIIITHNMLIYRHNNNH